ADEYLEGAKILNAQWRNAPKWATYSNAFQSLENFLKSYLLKKGKTVDYLKYDVGHKLQVALLECEKLGLVLSDGDMKFIDKMMEFSRCYTGKDFQYHGFGQWELFAPNDLIFFVDKIRDAVAK